MPKEQLEHDYEPESRYGLGRFFILLFLIIVAFLFPNSWDFSKRRFAVSERRVSDIPKVERPTPLQEMEAKIRYLQEQMRFTREEAVDFLGSGDEAMIADALAGLYPPSWGFVGELAPTSSPQFISYFLKISKFSSPEDDKCLPAGGQDKWLDACPLSLRSSEAGGDKQ